MQIYKIVELSGLAITNLPGHDGTPGRLRDVSMGKRIEIYDISEKELVHGLHNIS